MTGIIIAVTLGWLGGYRFYKKQIGLGLLYLFTGGLFGIGWIVDIVKAVIEYNKESSQSTISNNYQLSKTPTHPSDPIEPTFWIHKSKDTEKNLNQIRTNFIVLDTETTGVNSQYDRMISLAAIEYTNGSPQKKFYTLINPQMPIPPQATAVNSITNEMVRNAPSEHDACKSFLEFLGDAVFGKTLLVAYNAPFDSAIIKKAMERYQFHGNIRIFDVLPYSRQKLKGVLPNYKLSTVAESLGINTSNAHNAMKDCEMCAEVLLKLVDY